MSSTAIQRVIALLGGDNGGQSELARRVGVRPQSVQRWASSGKVPAERVPAVETAVDGAVTRYELRPDIFGDAPPFQRSDAA